MSFRERSYLPGLGESSREGEGKNMFFCLQMPRTAIFLYWHHGIQRGVSLLFTSGPNEQLKQLHIKNMHIGHNTVIQISTGKIMHLLLEAKVNRTWMRSKEESRTLCRNKGRDFTHPYGYANTPAGGHIHQLFTICCSIICLERLENP